MKEKNSETTEASDVVKKRENMVLYLLINYPQETKEIIKSNIDITDFKLAENKMIFEKIIASPETDSEKITQLIANIEDEKIQTHISEIMVVDYEITSIQKCIEDVILIYNKERLQNRKLQIIKELENPELTKEEMADLDNKHQLEQTKLDYERSIAELQAQIESLKVNHLGDLIRQYGSNAGNMIDHVSGKLTGAALADSINKTTKENRDNMIELFA